MLELHVHSSGGHKFLQISICCLSQGDQQAHQHTLISSHVNLLIKYAGPSHAESQSIETRLLQNVFLHVLYFSFHAKNQKISKFGFVLILGVPESCGCFSGVDDGDLAFFS